MSDGETMSGVDGALTADPAPPEPAAAPATPAAASTAWGEPLDDAALDRLFRLARTHYRWRPEEVDDATLRRLYDLLRLGPTSANSSPARFVFLRSPAARERLRPALSPGNIASAMTAPVVVIVAHDPQFYDHLSTLYPTAEARGWFANDAAFAEVTAFRNGTLQGAYLILAARALGLDCGPMSGFDEAKVDAEFTAGFGWKSNFLVALGHAEDSDPAPRAPRLDFDTACHLL